MSSGIEGKDEVAARELISRLENSFEFNQLVRVFNPQQKNALRKRQQSSKQVEQLRGWVAKHLRELHRLRFVQLSPSINADLDRLTIFRMPGLSRFLEPARRSLDLEYDGHSDLDQAIRSIWSSIDWDEDNAAEDTEPEDT
jgi:chromosome partition protein MukE